MELKNEFRVGVPAAKTWEVFTDVERVAPCLPGATLLSVDGDEFTGAVKVKVGPITVSYKGIAVYKDGTTTSVYVTNAGTNKVFKFEYTDGNLDFVKSAGSQGSGSSSFNGPAGIAADSCGNLWVADRNNNRIQILDKDLSFKSRFTASFDRPTGVAFGPNTTQLFVVDSANAQVQKFSLNS